MMHPFTYIQQLKQRQTGAVLVMALVLLTVMTLIGVASMTSSSMQMRVASNMQQHNIAFQGAQSRIAEAISPTSPSPINFKINIPDLNDSSTWPVQTCNVADGCLDGADWGATASTYYKGCTTGFGNSLEAGKSIAVRTFEIDVTATAAGGIARSIQRQGVRGTVKDCGYTS